MSNALALQHPPINYPPINYPPINYAWHKGDPRARAASIKGNAKRRELATLGKGLRPEASPPVAARLSHLRRTQRVLITGASAVHNSAQALEYCKAARELFEIEQELLGRRPLKAGKVPRQANAEQARRALQLPDVASLPRPDGLDTAPAGYDPHAGLPALNTGAAQKHLAEAQAAPTAPQGQRTDPTAPADAQAAQQRNLFAATTVPAPPTPGPAPTR